MKEEENQERERCWQWLGIYLLYSLLMKPALQQARAVNTQADSLVSDHLLPGSGRGWGASGPAG